MMISSKKNGKWCRIHFVACVQKSAISYGIISILNAVCYGSFFRRCAQRLRINPCGGMADKGFPAWIGQQFKLVFSYSTYWRHLSRLAYELLRFLGTEQTSTQPQITMLRDTIARNNNMLWFTVHFRTVHGATRSWFVPVAAWGKKDTIIWASDSPCRYWPLWSSLEKHIVYCYYWLFQ